MESTEWLLLHCFQVELEFGNVGFCGGRKTGEPGEKPSVGTEQGREPTKNSHWWEASAFTTALFLLPQGCHLKKKIWFCNQKEVK